MCGIDEGLSSGGKQVVTCIVARAGGCLLSCVVIEGGAIILRLFWILLVFGRRRLKYSILSGQVLAEMHCCITCKGSYSISNGYNMEKTSFSAPLSVEVYITLTVISPVST